MNSAADLAENIAPARGAGPTAAGRNTPVPSRGRSSPPPADAGPRARDLSQATTGQSLFQRANAVAARRAGTGR